MTASVRKSACCLLPLSMIMLPVPLWKGDFLTPKPVLPSLWRKGRCIAGPCMKKGKTAFYSKAAQKVTEVRTGRFCKRDLQAKSGSSVIVQIGDRDRTSVTGFGSWLWHKLHQSLEKDLGVEPVAEHRPIARILFSDRYCNSPLTAALLYRLLSHLEDVYGEAWSAPSFFVMLADRISGEYSQVWDNWSRASERDEAVRRLLSELGTVKVVPMDKKMMAHARSRRLHPRWYGADYLV